MSFLLRTVAVASALAITVSASPPTSTCTDGYGAPTACPIPSSTCTDGYGDPMACPSSTAAPLYNPPPYPTGYPNSTWYPSARTVPGWDYVGCVSSANPSEFSLVETSSAMTIERCLLDCSAYEYALIHDTQCFCAQAVNTTFNEPDGLCHTPCPADHIEACGGQQGVAPYQRRYGKRAAPTSTCSDSYGASAACPTETVSVSPIVGGPLYSLYESAIVAEGDIYITIITSIYIDFCEHCPGGTSTCTTSHTTTLTACGCTSPVTPIIPMATATTVCHYCVNGGPGTVTYEIPDTCSTSTYTMPHVTNNAVTRVYPMGSTAVHPMPVYTGAANSLKHGAAGAAALIAGFAML